MSHFTDESLQKIDCTCSPTDKQTRKQQLSTGKYTHKRKRKPTSAYD